MNSKQYSLLSIITSNVYLNLWFSMEFCRGKFTEKLQKYYQEVWLYSLVDAQLNQGQEFQIQVDKSPHWNALVDDMMLAHKFQTKPYVLLFDNNWILLFALMLLLCNYHRYTHLTEYQEEIIYQKMQMEIASRKRHGDVVDMSLTYQLESQPDRWMKIISILMMSYHRSAELDQIIACLEANSYVHILWTWYFVTNFKLPIIKST